MRRHSILAAVALTLLTAAYAAPAVASRSGGHGHGTAASRHRPKTTSFYARVVRPSRKGLKLRTRSGRTVFFSARQLKRARPTHRPGHGGKPHRHSALEAAAGPVTINILGLQ